MILVIYAHPYPSRSRGCASLLAAIADLPGLEVRSLYEMYPDFDVDARGEQAALERARLVVWLHPVYWYGPPALAKHWFEKVLLEGFAYGKGGDRLAGKPVVWAVTTGGGAYAEDGPHRHAFAEFTPAVEMTARYCGMEWLEPVVVHDVAHLPDEVLRAHGAGLRARLAEAVR